MTKASPSRIMAHHLSLKVKMTRKLFRLSHLTPNSWWVISKLLWASTSHQWIAVSSSEAAKVIIQSGREAACNKVPNPSEKALNSTERRKIPTLLCWNRKKSQEQLRLLTPQLLLNQVQLLTWRPVPKILQSKIRRMRLRDKCWQEWAEILKMKRLTT